MRGGWPEIKGNPFEVRCSVCNAGVCKEVEVVETPTRKMPLIIVKPCWWCAKEKAAGRDVPRMKSSKK